MELARVYKKLFVAAFQARFTGIISIYVTDNRGIINIYFFLPPAAAALVSAIAARAARVTTTVATGTVLAFKISIPGT